MRSATSIRLDLLAHHEAGHAAIARHFGLRLRTILIDPRSDNGATELLPGEHPTRLQHALILLAGGRAELVIDPDCLTRRMSTLKDEADLAIVISNGLEPKLLHKDVEYVDALSERIDQRLANCCQRLVTHHWSAIQRLAAALRVDHEIAGSRAESLLTG